MASWLEKRPKPELLDAWREYVSQLKGSLDAASYSLLRTNVLQRAQQIAEAAGGFLGLGEKVSAQERAVLDDLASAFN